MYLYFTECTSSHLNTIPNLSAPNFDTPRVQECNLRFIFTTNNLLILLVCCLFLKLWEGDIYLSMFTKFKRSPVHFFNFVLFLFFVLFFLSSFFFFFSNLWRFWYFKKVHIFSHNPMSSFTVDKCSVWKIAIKTCLVMVAIIKLTG